MLRLMQMDNRFLALASDIIQRSNRLQPADAVLRSELKKRTGLRPGEATRISRAVFAYFRWLGWLDQKVSFHDQILKAVELAERFTALERGKPPLEFSGAEMVRRAIPNWLLREMEITPALARWLQTEPKLWLRARPGRGSALAAKLGDCFPFGPGVLSDILEYRGNTDLFRTPEFHAGAFELQDISSQAVSLICAPSAGETWWDACAGEGGKTLHLCDLMGNKGLVWASDRAEWRLQRLKRRAARSRNFNYRARLWDGSGKLPTKTKFDGVLLDAPCSGIGTWQRNPHARWTTTLQDIHELGALQTKLLTHAAVAVKPGGKLIYAVCTLTRNETIQVAETFQSQFSAFIPLPLTNPLAPDSEPAPHLILRPELHGGNGMFIAAWKRE